MKANKIKEIRMLGLTLLLTGVIFGEVSSNYHHVAVNIPIEGPTGIAVNSNNNMIYVTSLSSNTICVIDGNTDNIVATIPVGARPVSVGVNLVTNRIYVGHSYQFVTVIDGAANTILTTIPTPGQELNSVAVNHITNRIYVTSRDPGGRVLVIDGNTNTIISVISVAANPDKVTVNRNTNCVYVGHGTFFGRTRLTIIDGATNTAFDGTEVGLGNSGITVDPTTNLIYLHKGDFGNPREGRPFVPFEVLVIDGTPGCTNSGCVAANTIIAAIPLGTGIGGGGQIAVNPTINRLYVAEGSVNNVVVIDINTNTVVENIPVGLAPNGLDVNPVTNKVYVGNIGSNTVSVIEVIPSNTPPIASAGENVSINSENLYSLIINGSASDPDLDDVLQYRWLENEHVLFGWANVSEDGYCDLSLSNLSLEIGQHTLTLEVTDGKTTVADKMILTIDNSAPSVAITGGPGTYELFTPITLSGEVSDYDGDLLNYEWLQDNDILCNGQIQPPEGGNPISLQDCIIDYLPLGTHTISLSVDDYINDPVSTNVNVEVTDGTKPTLAPVSNKSILWPPNHEMVDIVIEANAEDNSGFLTLSVSISSDEPKDGLGDGDASPDWTEPVLDQSVGLITLQLRAERSGKGDGRIYTILITATDQSYNSSSAEVEVVVPHNKGNKK